MQVDVDEVIHVRLEGALVEQLTKVDQKLYSEYLVTGRERKAGYVCTASEGTVWYTVRGHALLEGSFRILKRQRIRAKPIR